MHSIRHRWQRAMLLALVVFAGSTCDGSPDNPSLLPNPPAPGSGTVTGVAVNYEGGAPVPGATVVLAGISTLTDAEGRFTLRNVPEAGNASITVNAPGYVFRAAQFALAPNRDVRIDVLRDVPPFSLFYYRQWARNSIESSTLAATRPWTMNPNFYLRRTMDDSSAIVPETVIAEIQRVFAASIPELSGHRLQIGTFEVGDTPRALAPGWVNVTFSATFASFGRSTVGGNSGEMLLRYFAGSSNDSTNPRNCSSPEVGIADHEITHTMGFWHTLDIDNTFSGAGCPGNNRPAHVRYHSTVMYARPSGNLDPDVDPPGSVQSVRPASRAVVQCIWPR